MVRLARAEVFDPNEGAIAHVYNRTVRTCFLMGDDAVSGKNFDHQEIVGRRSSGRSSGGDRRGQSMFSGDGVPKCYVPAGAGPVAADANTDTGLWSAKLGARGGHSTF